MFEEYWEAPERLWRQDIGEEEADAITVRAFAAAFLLGMRAHWDFGCVDWRCFVVLDE